MATKKGRDISAASNSTTLSEEIDRALNFAPTAPPPSPRSQDTDEGCTNNPDSLLLLPEAPREILRRTLMVRSVVSTSLSFADRMNRARAKASSATPEYRIIGIGSCGTVFKVPGTAFAVKKGEDITAMWKDFILTNRVHNAVTDTRTILQGAFKESMLPKVPECTDFMLPESEYWQTNLDCFPTTHRKAGAAFHVTRILPLPKRTREALIENFFADGEGIQAEAKQAPENKDCLVRIYLGENEKEKVCYDSLRNFPLHLNVMEDLDLEPSTLASQMAIALAIIHWQAKVDAMDSEFVLGSSVTTLPEKQRAYAAEEDSTVLSAPHEIRRLDSNERSTNFWVLDFDKASPIELTADDVIKKLVVAFLGNDPYFPRPDVDEDLWQVFSKTYLKASRLILENKQEKRSVMGLPKLFLETVAEMIKAFEKWDPEEEIVFGD